MLIKKLNLGKLEIYNKNGIRDCLDHRDGLYEDLDLMVKAIRHALAEHNTVKAEWHLREATFE